MKKLRSISLLYRYIVTYASLILLCCAVIGSVLTNAAIQELNRQSREHARKQIDLIAADLDRQYDLMEDTAYRIAANYYCQPRYLDRNKYYEIDLVQEMKKYIGISPFIDHCFLLYEGDDHIYRGGAKNRLSVFAGEYLDIADSRQLYRDITATVSANILIPEAGGQDSAIFVFPIEFDNYPSASKAFVCFTSSGATISQRVADMAGALDGRWELLYADRPFARSAELTGDDPNKTTITSAAKKFTVQFSADHLNSGQNYFQRLNTGIIILIALAFLILTVLSAYSTYMPIKRLQERFIGGKGRKSANEIGYINQMIDELQAHQGDITRQLDEQFDLLAHQQFLLLLQGQNTQEQNVGSHIDRPPFNGDRFAAIAIRPDDQRHAAQEICRLVEELSGGGINYLAAEIPSSACIAVLISLDETAQCDEAVNMISEMLEALSIAFKMGIGTISGDLQHLSASFRIALAAIERQADKKQLTPDSQLCAVARHGLECRNEGMLLEILNYIQEHVTEYDLDQDRIAEYFGISSNQLYRLIKTGTGNSYKHYVTDLRMRRAGELLANGATVADACNKVGYVNVSYFIKTFKELNGCTPASYRLNANRLKGSSIA